MLYLYCSVDDLILFIMIIKNKKWMCLAEEGISIVILLVVNIIAAYMVK